MADESEVIKDPTQKKFWRTRNIVLLTMTATLPALCGWAGNTAIEKYTAVREWKHRLDARLDAADAAVQARLKDLEDDKANNKAIWDAIAEIKNKQIEMEVEHRVAMRLFEREFGRARDKGPSTTAPPKGPDFNVPPPDPLPAPPVPKIDPDQYRLQKEQKFPVQKK